MAIVNKPTSLLHRIEYEFKDETLLMQALTHSSADIYDNYERLEFLGDRVLGLVVANILFHTFPNEKEGDLAKRHAALVQGKMLAFIADEIDLGAYLDLSVSERGSGGDHNENILADAMEALIAALYIDGGIKVCERVIRTLWGDTILNMTEPPKDSKTTLQEWAQSQGLPLPIYTQVKRDGPDHAPIFYVSVTIEGHAPIQAKGPSLRKAEKKAAKIFLNILENGLKMTDIQNDK